MSSDKIELSLQPRGVTGKKVAVLRRQGEVPGVIYGADMTAENVSAPALLMDKVYRQAGRHHPVYLNLEGKKRLAMIKRVDVDPVKRTLRHVSFHAVKQNEKVEAEIPVVLLGEGESPAEKSGLVVLQTLETLPVTALPANLPDRLEVSIERLSEPGQHVTVADINLPEGVELQEDDDERVIASVYEPSALQAANEAAGGDAEPEDVSEIEAEHGEDTEQTGQAEEDRPGGKGQKEPKPSSLENNP
ncbi:MAG: 50S ribosomal protein L25 [Candidatus Chaera renei]|uniref:Large ribosomal subunit protein bL25 n=1 Tax=Candidatus Chaera renei TaxID=2506947 RepID=A0A4Q0AJQ8_9BACT|nr:MAG: 50S ribosomal protein L25 [Candidatus Chaera renei]